MVPNGHADRSTCVNHTTPDSMVCSRMRQGEGADIRAGNTTAALVPEEGGPSVGSSRNNGLPV